MDTTEEQLCALTALTDEQLAGLERLAQTSDAEIAAFAARVDQAWEANRAAVPAAKDAVRQALRDQAAVEVECGNAARARAVAAGGFPVLTEDEAERTSAARARTDEARTVHEQVKARFKAGVTAEQLTEV